MVIIKSLASLMELNYSGRVRITILGTLKSCHYDQYLWEINHIVRHISSQSMHLNIWYLYHINEHKQDERASIIQQETFFSLLYARWRSSCPAARRRISFWRRRWWWLSSRRRRCQGRSATELLSAGKKFARECVLWRVAVILGHAGTCGASQPAAVS